MDMGEANDGLPEGDTVYGSRKVTFSVRLTIAFLTPLTEGHQIERTKEDAFHKTKTKETIQTISVSLSST